MSARRDSEAPVMTHIPTVDDTQPCASCDRTLSSRLAQSSDRCAFCMEAEE